MKGTSRILFGWSLIFE